MSYLLVLVVSLLVGVGTYVVTVRSAREDASLGFGGDEKGPAARSGDRSSLPGDPSPGYAYLQVSTQGPARRDRLLVPVNCAALGPGVITSELFGHEAGAFTGAVGRTCGVAE